MIDEDFSTWHTQAIKCPWCLYEHSDSWEVPDWVEEEECGNCDKKFSIERTTEITYTTLKI
jgi:hypothetical protein